MEPLKSYMRGISDLDELFDVLRVHVAAGYGKVVDFDPKREMVRVRTQGGMIASYPVSEVEVVA